MSKADALKSYAKGNKTGMIVLIGTVSVVGILVAVAYSKKHVTPPSNLGAPPSINSVAGASGTPEYNRDVAQQNAQAAQQAIAQGQSSVPTPIGIQGDAFDGKPLKPMLGVTPPAPKPKPLKVSMPAVQNQVQVPVAPAAYADEVKEVLASMTPSAQSAIAIQATQAPGAAQGASPNAGSIFAGFAGNPNAGKSATAANAKPSSPVHAGSIEYGVFMLGANSDDPGPVVARIPGGPLAGATLIGGFHVTGQNSNYLAVAFSQMYWKGQTWSIAAMAVNPQTSLYAVRSAVDNHTLSRYASLMGGAFLGAVQGYGQAIAQSGQTTVQTVGTNSSLTTNPQMSAHDAAIIAGATAAGTVAQTIGQSIAKGWNQAPTVSINPGTGMGVLFLGPAQEMAGAAGAQSSSVVMTPGVGSTLQSPVVSTTNLIPKPIVVGAPLNILNSQTR